MDNLEKLLKQEVALMQRHYKQIRKDNSLGRNLAISNYYVYKHQCKKTLVLIELTKRGWPAG